MRVVAGAAKGRRLVAPPGRDVRPTSDRVKEALFSSLQPRLPGARVLDLYAGAGGLGIEALSRGASEVVFVERARPALDALRRNLATVDLPGATVLSGDVAASIRRLSGAFDLVLADPPYALEEEALSAVLDAVQAVLAPGAVVVVERARKAPPPQWPPHLLAEEPRRYGDTTLHRAVTQGADGDASDRSQP